MSYTKYDDETLKHLQNVELMILNEFIRICDENNLIYYMYAGSLLGAIRHKGFIPWDDDLDVVMYRKDFEKFKEIFIALNHEKLELLCNETESEYFYLLSKLMLKGTRFEESWLNQVDFHIGINIDIFVLDDLADNKLKRFYQLRKSFWYNKMLIMSSVKLEDLPLVSKLFSHTIYHVLRFFNVRPKTIYNKCLKFLKKYADSDSNDLFDISATAKEYPLIFRKKDFSSVKKVKFEDIEVSVPVNYDYILKSLYGDYMELPPVEERYNHPIENLDFGEY